MGETVLLVIGGGLVVGDFEGDLLGLFDGESLGLLMEI